MRYWSGMYEATRQQQTQKTPKRATAPGEPLLPRTAPEELRLRTNLHGGDRGVVAALRRAARSPRGAPPRQSAVGLGFFRNEPRLRSVANPSHQWLAPREPGCWGVSHSLAFLSTALPAPPRRQPPRYSFMKAVPGTVPIRPQRRTGQPRRRRRAGAAARVESGARMGSQCANGRTSCRSARKGEERRGEGTVARRRPDRMDDVGG